MDFEAWCDDRKQNCPQFHYWAIAMELEICILTYVRSLREANFAMYLDALTELVSWFCALDHYELCPMDRMMLHVAHAAQHDHHHIPVRTVDTDVVVLAVMVAETLPADNEVWIEFGTGKHL